MQLLINVLKYTQMESQRPIVAPFWRGHVELNRAMSRDISAILRIDDPGRATEVALTVLRYLPAQAKQNIHRILTAGLVADAVGGEVHLVEGCRRNFVERETAKRYATGSFIGACMMQFLKRIECVPNSVPVHREDESRCTDWEASTLLGKVQPEQRFIGIAGPHFEPSTSRAKSVVSRLAPEGINAEVYAPKQAVQEFGLNLNCRQQHIFDESGTLWNDEMDAGRRAERDAERIQWFSDTFALPRLSGKWSHIAMAARILPSRRDMPARVKTA